MNSQGLAACRALANSFDLETCASTDWLDDGQLTPLATGPVTFGIEIEVPFSSYFPSLWAQYRLNERHMGDLSPQERQALSTACTLLENELCPRLFKTTECGIPRGADRYWEFAPRPVGDTRILAEQVRLLTAAGTLPRDKPHSLHVTLGGLPRLESLYYLTMAAEVLFVDPRRIARGIEQVAMRASRQELLAGWGKKGSSGLYAKPASELEGGVQGVEIRVLQLPREDADFSQLMALIQWGANAIHACRYGGDAPGKDAWPVLEDFCKGELARYGLPAANWFTSGSTGGLDWEAWQKFAEAMPSIGASISKVLDELDVPGWTEGCPAALGEACQDRFA